MKKNSYLGQITLAAAALMLFTSAQAEARMGTNGGGGGGVILCPGRPAELTDFWELRQSGEMTSRLKSLRTLPYEKAKQVFAKNLAFAFDERGADSTIADQIDGMMEATRRALETPGFKFEFEMGDFYSRILEVSVDENVADPDDSGMIQNLNGSGCREERVAVSIFDAAKERTSIRIRRPDLFAELPPLDQIALIYGHEFVHSQTQGNIGRLETIGKSLPSNSEMVRRFNAWVATATEGELENFLWRPDTSYRVIRCRALQANYRGEEQMNIVSFNLYLDKTNKQTIMELDRYKSFQVWLPVRADIALTEDMLLIPDGADTNIPAEGPSSVFMLKMNLQQPLRAKLFQAEVGQTIFSPVLRDTSFSIELSSGLDKQALLKVRDSHGAIEYSGEIRCNSKH